MGAYSLKYSFLGGLNDTASDEDAALNEMSTCVNWEPDDSAGGSNYGGGLRKRNGISAHSALRVASINSIYQGRNANYFTCGAVTFAFTNAVGLEVAVDNGLADAYGDWASFATYDIMVNGTDARKTDDGANFTAVAGAPAGARYVTSANNFLYMAGHNHGELVWTNAGTITFNAVNALILTQDEGNDIVGIKPWRNNLFVLCERSFFLISHFTTLSPQIYYFSNEVGGTSFRSICVTPSGVFWWSRHGIVWLKPDLSIDYPMKRKLMGTLTTISPLFIAYAHAVHDTFNRRVMFFVSRSGSVGYSDLRVDYYYNNDTFFTHTPTGYEWASSGEITDATSENTYIYVGEYGWGGGGYLYRIIGPTDSGSSIVASLSTKRQSTPEMNRRVRNSSIDACMYGGADMIFSACVDDDVAVTQQWNITGSAAAGVISRQNTTIGINKACKRLKYNIYDASAYATRLFSITEVGEQVRTI